MRTTFEITRETRLTCPLSKRAPTGGCSITTTTGDSLCLPTPKTCIGFAGHKTPRNNSQLTWLFVDSSH